MNKPHKTGNLKSQWSWLVKAGSIVAWVLLALFIIGITGVGNLYDRFAFIQNNWLIVLFKMNIESYNAQASMLNVFTIIDLAIMVLFCVLFIALFCVLNRVSKVLSSIATSLPFLGIIIFLITHTAGRSGLLIGVLLFSIVMLKSNNFSKTSAWLGIIGSSLLFFAGDIGTTVFPSSMVIAILIAIGYMLWMIWFALIGRSLLQISRKR